MNLVNGQGQPEIQPIEKVAAGQKIILYALLLHFVSIGLQIAVGDIAVLLGICAIIMSLVGFFRLASGLGYSMGTKICCVILLALPLIGLIALLAINSTATKALREAGYKVGLLGAEPKSL